eukprot:SAG31_NODE_625_length_13462_cov_3.785153_1_plen_238_part_10
MCVSNVGDAISNAPGDVWWLEVKAWTPLENEFSSVGSNDFEHDACGKYPCPSDCDHDADDDFSSPEAEHQDRDALSPRLLQLLQQLRRYRAAAAEWAQSAHWPRTPKVGVVFAAQRQAITQPAQHLPNAAISALAKEEFAVVSLEVSALGTDETEKDSKFWRGELLEILLGRRLGMPPRSLHCRSISDTWPPMALSVDHGVLPVLVANIWAEGALTPAVMAAAGREEIRLYSGDVAVK